MININDNNIEEYLDSLPENTEIVVLYGRHLTFIPETIIRFGNLKILACSYNNLTELPDLPKSLKKLSCTYNQLTQLPFELPESLEECYCSDNQLTQLPELPQTLKKLHCYNNKLTYLPELPPSLEECYCGFNKILELPKLPQLLKTFFCNKNELTFLPTELPDSLLYFDCCDNNITSCLPNLPPLLKYLNSFGNNLPYPNHPFPENNRYPHIAEFTLNKLVILKIQEFRRKLYYYLKIKPHLTKLMWKAIENISIRDGHQDRMWEMIKEADDNLEDLFS